MFKPIREPTEQTRKVLEVMFGNTVGLEMCGGWK